MFSILETQLTSSSGNERAPFEDSDDGDGAAQEVAVVIDEGRQQDSIIAGQEHEQPKLPETETQGRVLGTELIDGGGEGMNMGDGGATQEVAVVVDEGRQQDAIIAGQKHEQPKLPEMETQGLVLGTDGGGHPSEDEIFQRAELIAIKIPQEPVAVGQQQHDEMWQEIPQQEQYQHVDVPGLGTFEGGAEEHQEPVQEAVGQEQQEIPLQPQVQDAETGGAEENQQPVQEAVGQEQEEIPPQPQLQDSELQGPVVGTATTERGGEGPQEPVQEPVGQQQDVVPASESQKIVKRPSRPRRPRQRVRKGECPM